MSYLQAFNFSSPFSVTNFGTFGGVPFHSTLTSTATATHFQQQQNPGARGGYTTAGATQLPLPESIVPNYNPGATTDYYGNPNQNFANQQAPIPPEYQQQQQQPQLQQQQQRQLQQQQQRQLQQQQQPQLQQQIPGVASSATLQIPPIGAPTSSSSQTGRGRDNQDGSFDVIIRENDPPPAATGGGKRKRVRKPPRVINYSPVYPVHYVPPVGPHTVSLHSEKVSLHDVIDQDAHHQQNPGQANHQSNILNGNADQSIPSVIPPIPSANNNNNDDDGGDYNNPPGRDLPARGNNNNLNININSDAQVINAGGIGQGPAGNSAGGDIQQLTNFGGIGGIGSSNPPNVPVSNNFNEAPPQNSNSLPPSLPQQGNSQNQQQQVQQTQPLPQAQAPQQQDEQHHEKLRVTPIQGPIYAKDGLIPVVPLYHYNSVKNGTYYQIPILWTALSYALGLEIHGEILRGLPCIKRLNQLYCPSAGQSYPIQKIEGFIDENKALIRRMYGEFIMSSEAYSGPPGGNVLRRSTREIFEDEVPDLFPDTKSSKKNKRSPHHHSAHQDHFSLREPPADDHGDFGNRNGTIVNMPSLPSHTRQTRQTVNNRNGSPSQQPRTNRVDSCESTVEIVTPYWAANSGGKVRAIVNTQHFEQAIHQEVCRQTSTRRCSGECGCEQKYKWHRLLAYDPDNDCRGIFMDWFLFPSCCVCRCNPQNK